MRTSDNTIRISSSAKQTTSADTIHVIGHRNPDTDAICSAIGYAAFLRDVRGMKAEAACCGEVSVRTNWVLQTAGVSAPKLLLDVRPTASTICRRDVFTASAHQTFLSVYRMMMDHNFRSIPIVDEEGRLLGLPAIQELAQLFLPAQTNEKTVAANREVRTSLLNIVNALDGIVGGTAPELEAIQDLVLVVAASSMETTRKRAQQFPASRLVVVTGDRPEIHELAVEMGVRCLIITGKFKAAASILTQAAEKGVAIIYSPYDTASTSQLLRFSRPIGEALTHEFLSFGSRTPLREIVPAAQHSSQPLFAVVDEETQKLLGVFSKSDLLDPPRMKLVLVDHNEFAQAVAGADEAEIIEVIDHHRLSGNLRTKEPIRFINEPVGSTSTIVGIMYRMRDAAPDKSTAICLCAGIISDTLHLTSPTTTSTDKEILEWLAGIGGIDSAQFVKDFFAAGSMLREHTPDRALESDRKVFEENGWHISISQIEELGLDEFWKREAELQGALQSLLTKHNLHFACLMVTDITRHHSVLLVAGDQRVIDAIDYPQAKEHVYDMAGVVSRKKQLFPYMSHVVTKLEAP
jgi:manganese-dependent inorganic pyrophosphatase|uniref:putative manganese-dependent inorganic diphosphatase n=1 Tax=Prosthecobacter sp. TaxID=1965333 RepID=UPI00378401FD